MEVQGGMKKDVKIEIKDLNFYYAGGVHALKGISMPVHKNEVTALIGPSGCGKTTFLRCLNRMHDLYHGNRYEGEILLDGKDILGPGTDLMKLRTMIGMVFQKPTPFPLSVFENIAFGLRLRGVMNKGEIRDRVEKALKDTYLWDETKDRLMKSSQALSGGQQQRLCIARAVAVRPDTILFDEPCSALDPVSTSRIEDLMAELKENYTIVIVTHNMQQAARVSEYTGFFMLGEMVEFDETQKIFTNPSNKLTESYITGRFG